MMNKNDLRYKKTEKLLTDVYMKLKEKSRKRIKVVDLCKEAMINKTTFYSHYETMEYFHEVVCQSFVNKMLDECPHILDAFKDTDAFVRGLVGTFKNYYKTIENLFHENPVDVVNMVENYLLDIYCKRKEKENTEIRFIIGGATRILTSATDEASVKKTIRLIKSILLTIK